MINVIPEIKNHTIEFILKLNMEYISYPGWIVCYREVGESASY